MSPVLSDGDYIITKKPRRISPGLIYVIDHSDLGRIVKRVSHVDGERFIVSGDNPASTPSNVIAPIERRRIQGRAFLLISKQGLRRI